MTEHNFGLKNTELRVLYIASSLGRGLTLYFTHLALAIKKRLNNLIIVSGSKEERDGLFKNIAQHSGINLYINHSVDNPSLRNMIKSIVFFKHIINHENLDILHVQTLYLAIASSVSAKIFHRRKKIKILVTIHSLKHGSPYEKITYFFGSLILNLFSDLVIPVAGDAAKKLQKNGLNIKKIKVIHNGINLEYFDQILNKKEPPHSVPKDFLDKKNIIISYFAQLIHRKGHKYLILAVKDILIKYPNVKLIFTSDGPIKNELIKLTKKLGMSKNVFFTGRVSYEELYRILNITNIYAFPSLSELFPFAILEAMAARKPIISTGVGGIPEALAQGKTGIIVPTCSYEAFYEAIEDLLENPEKARQLGDNARRRVEREFEINQIANELTDCYRHIF